MMKLRKKALALAMSAAVLGGGASLAQAQFLAPDSHGQVLIYPYLTANAGWQTFLHVINTSTSTVAAKVRFRAASSSADVYDIILVLSPSDVWTAVVEQNGANYGVRPTDNSCTVPYFGKDNFQPFIVQTSEVYAEVIMMGVSNATATGTVGANARHSPVTGLPTNCAAVETAFASPASVAALTEFNTDLTVGTTNFLTGKFDLVHVAKGWSGAARATVLANFGAPPTPLVAGSGPYFNLTNMWSQAAGDFDHPTLAEGTNGLAGTNIALNKSLLTNEWVLNPNLGELSSWIVTFPTKLLNVNAITAVNTPAAQAPKLNTFGDGTSNCVTVNASLFNREEKPLILPSPGTQQLCNEANVVNFKNGAIDSSSVLASNVAVTVPTDLLSTGVLAGWMQLGMPTNSIIAGFAPSQTSLPGWSTSQLAALPVAQVAGPVGRPVVGFNVTARATPADAVVYDHAFRF